MIKKTSKSFVHLRLLQAELGEYMAPDWLGRAVTLNDLWNMNKTLIITYSHNPSVPSMSFILSRVYPAFIPILFRFYPDFILTLSRFLKNSLYPYFITS